jgi:hypothetical protein
MTNQFLMTYCFDFSGTNGRCSTFANQSSDGSTWTNPVPVARRIGIHELASLDVNRRQFVVRICFSVGIGQNEDAKELLAI